MYLQIIDQVKRDKPDGLLLIPFKKSEWESVKQIIRETGIPTIVVATLPILCVYPFLQRYFTKGVMIGAIKG